MNSFSYALLVGAVSSAGVTYDYKTDNGADWKTLTIPNDADGKTVANNCDGKSQSPINLITEGKTGHSDYKQATFDKDNLKKTYKDFDAVVKWDEGGKTLSSKVTLPDATQNFVSTFAGGDPWKADTTFNAAQFHFHRKSEHTIDGAQMDLEMHVVHLPTATKNSFFAGVLGMLFSADAAVHAKVPDATVTAIDAFFDSLTWTKTDADPASKTIAFKGLMDAIDVEKRWVYKGTLTTPPCTGDIYWNVLSTVYPIKTKTITEFEAQMDRTSGLKASGNWRKIQTVDEQNVHYMKPAPPADDTKKEDGATSLAASALTFAAAAMFGY